ncbi:mucin-2-like isoform X1 [Daphnia pulex]|uniref:mucin-2-like isoform X1 n=1 Tax=Daphnia pulex TaxID=6669 RepID=UPI001EDE8F09|nr:mucin-2-like isoform X1 [Daphnia pulex]
MGLSSWALALCFLVGLHSHPLSNLVKFVGNHEKFLNDIPAASGDFPYLCILNLNGYLCGGTLIGPSHILTAAHCLHGHAITEISKFSAVLNSLAIDGRSTGAVIRGVKDFIVHEQYNPSYKDNDIAIFILSSPVTNLSFATLPTDSITKATTLKEPTTKTPTTTPKPTSAKEKQTITENFKSTINQQNITTQKPNQEVFFTSTFIPKTTASTTAKNTTSGSDLVPLSNIFSSLLAIKSTTTQRPTTKTTITTTPHTSTNAISTIATTTAENTTSGSDLVPLSNIFSSLLAIKSTTTQLPTTKTTITTTMHTTTNAILTIATISENTTPGSDLVPLSNIFSSLQAIKSTTTQRPTTKTTITNSTHTTTNAISTITTISGKTTPGSDLVPLSNIFSSLQAIKSTATQRPTTKTAITTSTHTTTNAISTITMTSENTTPGSDLVPLSNIFSSLQESKMTTTQTPATAYKTTAKPNTNKTSKTKTTIATTTEGKPTSDYKLVPLSHFFSSTSAKSAFSTFANIPAVITGWKTTSLGRSFSKVLLKADVIIRDNSFCKSQYDSFFIGTHMLCASASSAHTCQDMSGGPLFVNGVQIGIFSWGNGCVDSNFAGIYTRVTNYLGWIATTKAQNP